MNDASKATSNERLAFTVASCINLVIILFAVVLQLVRMQAYLFADIISCALLVFVLTENFRLRNHRGTYFALSIGVVIMLIGIMAMCYVLSSEITAKKHVPEPVAAHQL